MADPVEHDGGNDLVDVEVGFEKAGDRPPQAAQHCCCQQADEPGQLEHDGAVQGTKGTQRVLAGSADVEQARLSQADLYRIEISSLTEFCFIIRFPAPKVNARRYRKEKAIALPDKNLYNKR